MTLLHIVLYNCHIDLSFVTSIQSYIEKQVSEGDCLWTWGYILFSESHAHILKQDK